MLFEGLFTWCFGCLMFVLAVMLVLCLCLF